jgi:hypothetical protein
MRRREDNVRWIFQILQKAYLLAQFFVFGKRMNPKKFFCFYSFYFVA